jgi:AmmeMemoRadiSam system protein A
MGPTLTAAARQELLRRARTAIARAIGIQDADAVAEQVGSDKLPSGQERGSPNGVDRPRRTGLAVTDRAGAFVSLHVGRDLRGCIGYLERDLPLIEVVERCAVSAAVSDPRFPSLSAPEWPRITIEISVLGPIEPVAAIREIEVGRHGLVAEHGQRRGLLLPQVATECGWSRDEFIEHTCRKAGLPKDAWQHGATLYKFEADVFGEHV